MSSPPTKRLRETNNINNNNNNNNYDENDSASTLVPSQVVYIKNLKDSVTEADFHDALSLFGPISYVLCLRDSNKALVEFEDIRSASECVKKAKVNPINVAGYPAIFQFSKSSSIRRSGLESQIPSKVLVLNVYNVLYPITISSQHGEVLRISLLKAKENLEVQALVEFDNVATAKRAKHAMNGADIYAGCCTLKVEFSVLDRVNVLRNSHDQWDYTVKAVNSEQIYISAPTVEPFLYDLNLNSALQQQFKSNSIDISPYNLTSPGINPSATFNLSYSNAFVNPNIIKKHNGNLNKSPVIMIYGLDVDYFNCDRVFNLVCSYGDCLKFKVKFLRSMTGTCMAEMKNAEDAQNAIQHLRGCTIFDKDLEFTFSRNETLRDPTTDVYKLPDQTPSFKDFSNSRNLRFNNPEAASKNKLVYPTKQLHFFNAPASMTEDRIRKIFENHGISPLEIITSRKKSDRSSSGFVTFAETSQALEALVICNHTPVKEPEIKNPYIFKLAFALEKEDTI